MNDPRKELPAVKTYAGGKPNYCTPVDAVNMTQERVDETVKSEHEPVGWLDHYEGRFSYFKHLDSDEPLYLAPPKRDSSSWVGLTDEEIGTLTVFDGLHHIETPLLADFIRAIEAKLKEKNT
jgi:hypothetical protein